MQIILGLLSNTAFILIAVLTAAVWARTVIGYFSSDDGTGVPGFLKIITEPFLIPVRILLEKLKIGGGLFDFSPALFSVAAVAVLAALTGVTF